MSRWLVLVSLLVGGCAVHGLTFVEDDRVHITTPRDRAEVTVPFRLGWAAEDLPAGQRYAVLVDRTPPPTGKPLAWLFRSRDDCKGPIGRAACGKPDYLAEQGVLLTRSREVSIDEVEDLTGDDRKRAFHEVTIVLVDGNGTRVGEGSWSREVEIEQ
jgi:hypothetical protein